MSNLTVRNLTKRYPSFVLEPVSFDLAPGKITGFIGRNGAGKTTTLKALMNIVHPDGGDIRFFGRTFSDDEVNIKQRIGFVSGGVRYYPKKRLKTITDTTRRFYPNWDEAMYRALLERFRLDEGKTPDQLSEGMKVKYALALALSHHAELLLLDEPTSGLDPVSRDDLLDVFLSLCDQGLTILFSTHITSDLEKCADRILYLKEGRLIADAPLKQFTSGYRVISLTSEQAEQARYEANSTHLGWKRVKDGYTALVAADADVPMMKSEADLETIMIHLEKE